MRIALVFCVISLAACQPVQPDSLTKVDWTNGKQPCLGRNLSFKDGKIAYNVTDGRIELFDIVSMEAIPSDAELVRVAAAPAAALRKILDSQGKEWRQEQITTFIFRVHDEKLSLAGLQRSGHPNVEKPTASQSIRFDLRACPSG